MREKNSPESWFVATVIVAFCLATLWLTLSFERMPPILKRGIQPSDFPQLVCWTIIMLTVYMLWRDPVKVTQPMGSKTLGSIILMCVFAALTQIDLFIALGVFAFALSIYWGERRISRMLLVGVAVPVGVFLLFDQVFKIRFPRGLLTNLWYG